jgi:hypothetical protein
MRAVFFSRKKYMGETILYEDEFPFPSYDVKGQLARGHVFWRQSERLTLAFVTDQLRNGAPYEFWIEFSAIDEEMLRAALLVGPKEAGDSAVTPP